MKFGYFTLSDNHYRNNPRSPNHFVADIIDEAGGLGTFMNWPGPTFTDSGGFQVLSLGAGFRKVLAMDTERVQEVRASLPAVANRRLN